MNLREMLAGVGELGYQHTAGKDQPAQAHLRAVRRELSHLIPDGMRVLVSGSGQSLPVVPWIAVLDPDVTTTAQEGLYVVYLFQRHLSRVYLSMNQGTTQHLRKAEEDGLKGVRARMTALDVLEQETQLLRSRLSKTALLGKLARIDLMASDYFLPSGYEFGNIAAVEYNVDKLPSEETLRTDLTQMLAFYTSCVEVKDSILKTEPGRLHTTSSAWKVHRQPAQKPPVFRPKSSNAYYAEVGAQFQERSRRHEALIAAFGDWIRICGLVPATNVHPRDLTVDSNDRHWLIEAKVVKANSEFAVREAIGQLFSYRHFYYRKLGRPDPLLVALFSEPPGGAFPPLLESLEIESIWRDDQSWSGGRHTNDSISLLKIAKANQSPES